MRKMKRGMALLAVLLIGGISLTLGVIAARIVYNNLWTARALLDKERAYWLSDGGLEYAAAKLANSNWYTDLPVAAADKKNWLASEARGVVLPLDGGTVKVVREKESRLVYAVGSFAKAREFMSAEINGSELENRKEL